MAAMNFRVHDDLNLIELAPQGEIHVDDILVYGHGLVDNGQMKTGTVEYVDMSGISNLHLSYESARKLQEMHRRWLECGWLGAVFFAPRDLQFGIVRMVGAIVQSLAGPKSIRMIPLRQAVELRNVREIILSASD